MNEITFPLQSTKTLIKALIAAIVIATVLFVTVILPAEYQTDPTGIGKILGLTVLTAEPAAEATAAAQTGKQKNQATIVVPPQRGVEYKFKMKQYAQMSYEWRTDNAPLYFDFHGEPKGYTTGYFLSYSIATTDTAKGTVTVPFEGVHGWYWKNTSDSSVVVTLTTEGDYEVVGQLH